ncbi:MAG: winged helix-turn-helix transcriptional regulator [Candidatus Thorarchaeota archaeon]|nr:winged helix-turn-helix transcriptional regulator [Candidatus Thorarchaeota archaeon]
MTSKLLAQIQTPFDDILPKVEDTTAQFYLDTMRLYLALSSGTVSYETALEAVKHLKKNPEFARSPINPTRLPINKYFTNRIIENLRTLRKFNLVIKDSIKSACSFAFLVQDNPISPVDFSTLSVLVDHPRLSFAQIAEISGLAPRTVSRSIKRLTERHTTRYRALLDYSAWRVNTVIVFFTPREGIDWQSVEDELTTFPFVKTMLKTVMTELGYVSVNIPGNQNNVRAFLDSIKILSKSLFEYVSIHRQLASSVERNLSLYKNGNWTFPEEVKLLLEDPKLPVPEIPRNTVYWRGPQKGLTEEDFVLASIAKLDARAPHADIAKALERRSINIDSKRVATRLRKLIDRNILMPYVGFALGLTSDFCFEIVCNSEWIDRIQSILPFFPHVTSFVSPRGVILWPSVPGPHQVEYYQMLRSLEEQSGVSSVQSIMTITQKGSRSILDLANSWKYTKNGYTAPPEALDLTRYLSDY